MTTTPSLGALPTEKGVRFSLFSTTASSAGVRLFDADGSARGDHALASTSPHHFELEVPGVGPGALYKLVLDGKELPDPYARFLPTGVHGPARVERRVTSPQAAFLPRPLAQWVIYEIHIGTFTPEGTYRAATDKLDGLHDLGITVIELMPIAAFAGSRGWGYDGVALFAPFAEYGEPDDLRAFIEAAHARGIAVLLDVVYNHVGPAGSYLTAFAPEYLAEKGNGWGEGLSFEEPHVRRMVLDNARCWLGEFDFDGLRLDATHAIADPSETHILTELAQVARSFERPRVLIAEDERNDPALVEQHRLDGVWADDFHHVARVTATGEQEGYYAAYRGGAEELARVIERGWLYEGQVYPPSGKTRGMPCSLRKDALVYCLENHDQVGNRALGNRLTDDISVDAYAGLAVLLFFLPSIPLLFMGQEWAASSPFLFFTDHDAELGRAITKGRREEFKGFTSFDGDAVPDPQALTTFERSKLRWEERATGDHARILALTTKLASLRTRDPVLSLGGGVSASVENGVLVVTREHDGDRRVLLYNPTDRAVEDDRLRDDVEPLVSSAPVSGGRLPGRAAVVLSAHPAG